MATFVRTLSAKTDSKGRAEILLRISISRECRLRLKTGIHVPVARFKNGQIIKPRANRIEAEELNNLENELTDLEQFITALCYKTDPGSLTKDYILNAVDRYRHPETARNDGTRISDIMGQYIATSELSECRLKNYKVVHRSLERFEAYKGKTVNGYRLTFEAITEVTLREYVAFLENETEIYKQYPDIYKTYATSTESKRKPRKPLPRGRNAITCMLKELRAFFNWSIKKGFTDHSPFAKFTVMGEKYGTPFYLTIEERNALAAFDFSGSPALERQRDIFIFQCLIGCRVSDLYGLTPESIIDGVVEYIPNKTRKDRPEVIRVPLNAQAQQLIAKYNAEPGKPLLPFISSQKYNEAIKLILKAASIDRVVTILNPTTGEEEKRPIYEVASTHMARRTFIGNLYKKVKDPNLVGSLSGHKEGSRAFARYRDIDDDIKKELINML